VMNVWVLNHMNDIIVYSSVIGGLHGMNTFITWVDSVISPHFIMNCVKQIITEGEQVD
jgi:hypothetical protein